MPGFARHYFLFPGSTLLASICWFFLAVFGDSAVLVQVLQLDLVGFRLDRAYVGVLGDMESKGQG